MTSSSPKIEHFRDDQHCLEPSSAFHRSRSVEHIDACSEDEVPQSHSFGRRMKHAVSSGASMGVQTVANAQQRGMIRCLNRNPKDFFFIKQIGEGAFSTVYLGKEVDTGTEYAIKVVSKELIQKQRRTRLVVREKNIMAALTYAHGGHPFVVSLYCTFQDAERLYFAMSYCRKGELLATLNRLGAFDISTTRFYAAEIVSGLQFLHKCGVIHRDLKPENILFQESGHICISDFGSAKICNENDPEPAIPQLLEEEEEDRPSGQRRSTFVGTAQYVSPEMLTGGCVGPPCDFWALGAIIFQMMAGQAPFRAVNDFHMMKKIQNLDYSFPDGFAEVPKDLVSKMLVLDPAERLGSPEMGNVEAIMEHPFFEDIDWDILPELTPPALYPYVPASGDEPEFYSEMTIDPGFDEKTITRLMGFNMKEFGSAVSYSIDEDLSAFGTNTTTTEILPGIYRSSGRNSAKESQEERAVRAAKVREEKLEKQRRENIYHRFVDDHLILKSGFLDKKKGLFARRRMFLLTEGPHLYYVDPATMELKGGIPWSACMHTEAKNFRTFFVHTPNRTYYLFDPERKAVEWCHAIDAVKARYQAQLDALGTNAQNIDPLRYKKNRSPPKKEKSGKVKKSA